MLASQVLGATFITGLLEGEDVLRTRRALSLLGVPIERGEGGVWRVDGVGTGGLREPADILDMGNSGTSARLMMGLCASHPFLTFFTGDESLRKRPMRRVMTPLARMGAEFLARENALLPLALKGRADLLPMEHRMEVASAQVKSALLLAGLNIRGVTSVIEPQPTRDHTERMLRFFGFEIEVTQKDEATVISLPGQQMPSPAERHFTVPGDPSSAAFLAVAALIVPGAEIILRGLCVNPLRIGLYATLQEMGADIAFLNAREEAGEPVADLRVRHSALHGVDVPPERAPSMIDEYPILAVAAAFAQGVTRLPGLEELKVKESDRLSAIAQGLAACGVRLEKGEDSLSVFGQNKPKGGGFVATCHDHRIAMSFLVMGMASEQAVTVDDGAMIATSFPGFTELMNQLGARIKPASPAYGAESGPASPAKRAFAPLVIAIDGPAASGKGTLARRLAEHMGYAYLDTGSLYRAVGLKLIYSGKDPYDKRAALDAALGLAAHDLSNPRLRQERVGKAASIISAIPQVRDALLDFQRRFAQDPGGAVLDGRDIGTVVCPDAPIKIFITASLEARARRRHRELQGEGIEVVYDSVLDDLRERDDRDARRAVAPMLPATDAIVIDTSQLDANAVFERALGLVEAYLRRQAQP